MKKWKERKKIEVAISIKENYYVRSAKRKQLEKNRSCYKDELGFYEIMN